MGIAGHMLGDRKLRRLRAKTGLDLDRAYIRGHSSEGRVVTPEGCVHYAINPETGEYKQVNDPVHWTSCPDSCTRRSI